LDLVGKTQRKPLVVKVSSKTGEGLRDLCFTVNELLKSNEWLVKHKQKIMSILEAELKEMVLEKVTQKTQRTFEMKKEEINKLLNSMLNKTKDPYTVSEELSLLIFSNK